LSISPVQIKELRELTGAGIMECKKALKDAGENTEKAIELLRKKGLAQLEKRSLREAKEGLIESYIHSGGRIGVLVEINCETDFVSRNREFKEFAHDVAMQIAASNPSYVSREDVPEEVIKKEKEIYKETAKAEGKPEQIVEKIAEGKLEKFFSSLCLLEQPFIKDPDRTMKGLLGELAGKIGENISIRRFTRYQLGEK
jgi:elongation factor Ts